MMPRRILSFAVALAVIALPTLAAAHGVEKEPYIKEEAFLKDVSFDQKLGAEIPLDLTFRDETGRAVTLGSYFGTKPVIMLLTYYNCTMLCPVLLDGLVRALRPLSFDMGKQYTALTVSINPRETPPMAAARKDVYIQRYGRKGAIDGWHFLTGREAAIQKLTQAVGFRYVYDAKKDEYAHAAGILILTPQGKVSRYYYGVEFIPRDLRLGLVEAAANSIGTPVDQLLLYCYHYDPLTGKYGLIIMNVLRLAGTATVLALGGFVLVMLRRDRRAGLRPREAR
jgi:protein SCO1/2